MRRAATSLSLAALAVAALAGCSQNSAGVAIITDRCVAGGESPEVCKCLAEQSSAKLDKEMFEIVVLGARGEQNASARLLRDIGPERQTRFKTIARDVASTCGANDYLVAN
jgi:hypothetical protein